MQYTLTTGAAVLLAFAPSVLAVGGVSVQNNCPFPVYYAAIGGQSAAMQPLPASGYSAGYSDEGVGFSIKLGAEDSLSGPITQFEYTWKDGKIYYDLSNINGDPFESEGMTLTPSMTGDSSNPSCQVVNCPAGEAVCTAAYTSPDDPDTNSCNQDSNLVLTLCTGAAKVKRTPAPEPEAAPGFAAILDGFRRIHARDFFKRRA